MKATLTYHSIDDSGSPISVPPEIFRAHVRWLATGRVRVLSLTELHAHPDSAGDAVAVTFDDGFLNVGEPVDRLVGGGLPATIFAVSGQVGGTNAWQGRPQRGIPTLPLLGWSDLERLVARGAAVEGHSRTHRSLTGLSPDALDAELLGCRDDLLARLGTRSAHVAYPYGDVNDTVAEHASHHYRFGHTTDLRLANPGDAPMRLPRIDMYYFRSPGALEAWGTPRFARRLAWIRTRRAIRARLLFR